MIMASKGARLAYVGIVVLLILSWTWSYLSNLSLSYYIAGILLGVFAILSEIFTFRKYYNKKLYLAVGVVFLVAMGVMVYMSFPPGENLRFFGLMVLGAVGVFICMYVYPKEWEKSQEELEQYDKVVE
ncbi:hypothetical protein BK007_04190 [Methanobacterium subterraneum]|jgi:peptidoglycan/LPS O-acetylase OafA/YrhL|uniref:Uncharacterized protein n=2 Tax=Methanobacterium subterraneum TaxID=59277 RepID=A0A2H4VB18_9EURY|nr:hypothetical protein BK007_04190 [Methanobacterium subterraneum]